MAKLSSLIGLTSLKASARMQIVACRSSGEIFPHSLLVGLGGTGKTEFARAIGDELGYHFVETHAATYKTREQLFSAFLEACEESKRSGLSLMYFVDEIHRLKPVLQEAFYSVLKEWWIPTVGGRLEVRPFTLIGATTRADMLDSNSFMTRFENIWEFSRYSDEDIAMIIADVLNRDGLTFTSEITRSISQRCLGVPRNAINLAKKVRLTVLAGGRTGISLADVENTFALEGIDSLGLRPIHRQYLAVLAAAQSGDQHLPVGVGVIAAKMRHSENMVVGSVEPLLLELDFVASGSRGRTLTDKGSKFLEKRA